MRDEFQSAEIVKCERIEEEIPEKYKQKIIISAAKKRDLLSLSKSGMIPKEYHDYYKTLTSNNTVKDVLPEPDTEEPDESDTDD